MQTNVHHPSDLRQVADGLRLVLRHAARLAEVIASPALRQHVHLEKRARSLALTASRASAAKHRDRDERLAAAVRELCAFADERCQQAMDLGDRFVAMPATLEFFAQAQADGEHETRMFFVSGLSTCAHIARLRLVEGETVALSDHLFSLFEPHTELIY